MKPRRYSDERRRKPEPLKALTIEQPFATFVVLGLLPFISRAAAAPRWAARRRIVIHAGGRPLSDDECSFLSDRIAFGEMAGLRPELVDQAQELLRRQRWADHETFPRSAGLGLAFLGTPRRADEALNAAMLARADVDPDRWIWPLRDPEPFAAPIPVRGQRGFWRWPGAPEIDARRRQLIFTPWPRPTALPRRIAA